MRVWLVAQSARAAKDKRVSAAGGCWKDEDTEIFLYQAEVFGEESR